jgi:hypothetical protein
MRLRTLHLARLMLLLSALGTAHSATRPAGDFNFRGNYITAVLFQKCVDACNQQSLERHAITRVLDSAFTETPSAALFTLNTAWTMRPPSAHAASLHALTGIARA